jgi:hypothetical protein
MPFIRPSAIMNGEQADAAEAFRNNAPRPDTAKTEALKSEAAKSASELPNVQAAPQTEEAPVATPVPAPIAKLDGASIRNMLHRMQPTR